VDSSALVPLSIGLFSALHCVGMCGGIIGALSISLPAPVRGNRRRLLVYVSAYSVGRVSSYALAGALTGLIGESLFSALSPSYGHRLVKLFAAALLIGIGLYLAGWFPRFSALERIGAPLWRRLEPLGQHLLPVRSLPQALLFGLIWGWLPCGLVYSTLLWSGASGSASQGALYMALFGIGTLPAVMGTGMVAGLLTRLARNPAIRRLAGVLLVVMALATLWIDLGAGRQDGHRMHAAADLAQIRAGETPVSL
jgi:sulfite exporter TauE/SafE